MPDLEGASQTIFDAYWDGKFVPEFSVRAGKFKPPVGLERLQSATDIAFAERGLPTNLVPSRDLGLQVSGDISEGLLAYQVGVFNGVPDLANGGDDLSDAKDFAARVFVQPLRAAASGVWAWACREHRIRAGVDRHAGLPSYRRPGSRRFSDTTAALPRRRTTCLPMASGSGSPLRATSTPAPWESWRVRHRPECGNPRRCHRRVGAHGLAGGWVRSF